MNDTQYIRGLIREGEHQSLDFKYAVSDSRKIARTMVAFANGVGGRLLIGVKDNGKIKGIRSEEEIHMIDTAAALYCRPVPEYALKVWEIEGLNILEVTVPGNQKRPFRAPDEHGRWRVYIRTGDHTNIANRVLIRSWSMKKSKKGSLVTYTTPEKILIEYLSRYPDIGLHTYRKIAQIPIARAENILVKLLSWDILKPVFTSKGIRYALNESYLPEESKKNKSF